MTGKLFTVEHADGEMIDIAGDGGFAVFTSRVEAQDALESDSNHADLKIVEYARA